MQVKVKFTAGSVVNALIEVERTGDVQDARKSASGALEAACGTKFPVNRLVLIYGGKQLANGMKIHEYGVKHNDTLLAHLRALVLDDPVELSNSEEASVPDTPDDGLVSPFPMPLANEDLQMMDTVSNKLADANVMGASAANDDDVEPIKCSHCDSTNSSKCKRCGCAYCGQKDDEKKTLACDECGRYYHMRCLPTPITELPKGDWYCEFCVNDPNIVIAGETKLDLSKSRKAKLPSAKQTKNWGGGMACAGTSKSCTIVDKDHIGPIPGVHVGQSWRYRIHLSGTGVHRPPVAGIAGTSTTPAVSIVLAGGYPEDEDRGDEFTYTGSGGYDLSGNKRTAKVQTSDQELTRQNLSLALACAAQVDDKNGAIAADWKQSTAIRVCRSYKIAKKHPEFAPEQGVRYDGLYRIVKYWKQKGESGHFVWRYLFRRDDPEPAPWTPEGKANIERWGLVLYDPDESYSAAVASATSAKATVKRATVTKRERSGKAAVGTKQTKRVYTCKPSPELLEMIRLDDSNTRMWATMAETTYASVAQYLEALCENALMCPICQELVQQPVTTPCGHNICNPCLCKAMKNYGIMCPICRHDIAEMGGVEGVRSRMNQSLVTILKALIPSYGKGWEAKPKVIGIQRALRSGTAVDE
ncbi:hypothetical protein GGI00_001476 [Coemansia sp. RSA 2681]|nr:hypothetical protein GGI00_001476 [Coemansia sp. RSA 2681]